MELGGGAPTQASSAKASSGSLTQASSAKGDCRAGVQGLLARRQPRNSNLWTPAQTAARDPKETLLPVTLQVHAHATLRDMAALPA